jgi:hypothetical protein
MGSLPLPSAGADPPAGPHPRNRIGGKLLLLAGSLALTFAVLEAGLRCAGFKPQTATVLSTYFQWDAQAGWRGRPNAQCRFTTTNFDVQISHGPNGFRRCGYDGPLAADASSPHRVVWCVGDSMTWGWGVDDGKTFVDCLNRQSADGTRYRNLGHPGFSPIQEYLLLKELFDAGYSPAQVLILFCINDLKDNVDGRDQSPHARTCVALTGSGKSRTPRHPARTPRVGWPG